MKFVFLNLPLHNKNSFIWFKTEVDDSSIDLHCAQKQNIYKHTEPLLLLKNYPRQPPNVITMLSLL